jgi:hypothetical protein
MEKKENKPTGSLKNVGFWFQIIVYSLLGGYLLSTAISLWDPDKGNKNEWKDYKKAKDTAEVRHYFREIINEAYKDFQESGGEKYYIYSSGLNEMRDYFDSRDYVIRLYGGQGDCSIILREEFERYEKVISNRTKFDRFLLRQFNRELN